MSFFSPLPFVFVETGEPEELPGGCGNNSGLFVELPVNLFLLIAYLSLLLALLFTFLPRFGVHLCGHARQRTTADVFGNHPSPFSAFFVVVEPATSLFDAHVLHLSSIPDNVCFGCFHRNILSSVATVASVRRLHHATARASRLVVFIGRVFQTQVSSPLQANRQHQSSHVSSWPLENFQRIDLRRVLCFP